MAEPGTPEPTAVDAPGPAAPTGPMNREPTLNRVIGRLGFGAININSVIGAGIFGLPAVAAAQAGDFSPWLFLLAGVMVFSVVLSFARAASMFRSTGGAIVYASHAFGPFVGFQTGWLSYCSRAASMGANTNLLVTYASWFWAPLDGQPYRAISLVLLISGITWLNVAGVRNSMAAVYLFTVLKLLPLSLLILVGLGSVDAPALFGAQAPEPGSLGETLLVLMYAYVGFEGTVVTAGEGRSPRRDMPAALINTIVAIGVIYFLVQMVSVAVLPTLADSRTALADVAAVLLGGWGAALLTLGAVFSISGNLSSSLLSAPRMTYALARDGNMPRWFGRVHPRFRTPANSVFFYGLLSLGLALSGTFIWLAAMSTLVRLLTYMVCIAALPRLERTAEAFDRQFTLPGGLLIPGVAMMLCLWLIAQASTQSWLTTIAFFALGSALYWRSTGTPPPAGG